MNAFNPRTFSSDWEVTILDRNLQLLDNEKLSGLAGLLNVESGLPVHMDWRSVEIGLGINRSLDQVAARIIDVTDRLTQLAESYDCTVFPMASHPRDVYFNASHVHVGTIHDEAIGLQLEAGLLQYTPVIAALGANSPFFNFSFGGFKSYRVRRGANRCTLVVSPRQPEFAQPQWGGDASPKLWGHPTLEVRILDCASSRRLLAELATFIAAFVHHLGTKQQKYDVTRESYKESIENRWLAAKHGLQATFNWNGSPRPVVEIANEMLDECGDALMELGARRSDLRLVEAMLQKRTCQADFALDLTHRYDEPYLQLCALKNRLREWSAFDEYLEACPTLEPAPALDRATILEAHLDLIGHGTHFYESRMGMDYPPTEADAVIEELVESGALAKEAMPDGTIALTRLAARSN